MSATGESVDKSATLLLMPIAVEWDQFLGIPTEALRAFEAVHRLNVTVHDLTGLLQLHIDPSYAYHRHPFCQAVKSGEFGRRCYAWEVTDLRPQTGEMPQGRAQVCHRGLMEWVVPVFLGETLAVVLFAGPRVVARSLVIPATDRPSAERAGRAGRSWRAGRAGCFRAAGLAESDRILESLRQLAGRLQTWLIELRLRTGQVGCGGADSGRRDLLIREFVHEQHTRRVTQLDLAERLGISPSRCAHVVRATTGKTLRQLLYDARVQTACWLLTQTDLPLKEVCRRVAVADLSYFHRLFRRRTGISPARYRRQHRT